MLLHPGRWHGRGSLRPADAALGTRFTANIEIADEAKASGADGWLLDATITVAGQAEQRLTIWIVADEVGTYAVSLRGGGLDAQGTAKLDSEPHLGLLWADDGAHVAFAVFALRDSHGIRGFRRQGESVWTWELALRPADQRGARRQPTSGRLRDRVGNVVSLAARRRGKPDR